MSKSIKMSSKWLPNELQNVFKNAFKNQLHFGCQNDAQNDDEIREMFLRLQNGVTLKAQEKRNAMAGKMISFVIDCSKHKFFTEKVGFKDLRFTHQLIAAQMILLELNKGPNDIRNSNLNNMYKDQKEFNENSSEAKKVLRTLDYLNNIFKENTPELKPYYAVTFYLLISTLMDKYVIIDLENDLFKFFLEFENYRQEEKVKSEDKDPEIIVNERGLKQQSDPKELEKLIDKVIDDNSEKVKEYKSGKDKLFGFFVGQVMKISGGKSNPKLLNEILKNKLSR